MHLYLYQVVGSPVWLLFMLVQDTGMLNFPKEEYNLSDIKASASTFDDLVATSRRKARRVVSGKRWALQSWLHLPVISAALLRWLLFCSSLKQHGPSSCKGTDCLHYLFIVHCCGHAEFGHTHVIWPHTMQQAWAEILEDLSPATLMHAMSWVVELWHAKQMHAAPVCTCIFQHMIWRLNANSTMYSNMHDIGNSSTQAVWHSRV